MHLAVHFVEKVYDVAALGEFLAHLEGGHLDSPGRREPLDGHQDVHRNRIVTAVQDEKATRSEWWRWARTRRQSRLAHRSRHFADLRGRTHGKRTRERLLSEARRSNSQTTTRRTHTWKWRQTRWLVSFAGVNARDPVATETELHIGNSLPGAIDDPGPG